MKNIKAQWEEQNNTYKHTYIAHMTYMLLVEHCVLFVCHASRHFHASHHNLLKCFLSFCLLLSLLTLRLFDFAVLVTVYNFSSFHWYNAFFATLIIITVSVGFWAAVVIAKVPDSNRLDAIRILIEWGKENMELSSPILSLLLSLFPFFLSLFWNDEIGARRGFRNGHSTNR